MLLKACKSTLRQQWKILTQISSNFGVRESITWQKGGDLKHPENCLKFNYWTLEWQQKYIMIPTTRQLKPLLTTWLINLNLGLWDCYGKIPRVWFIWQSYSLSLYSNLFISFSWWQKKNDVLGAFLLSGLLKLSLAH